MTTPRDPELQALLDRTALHELAMRYARAIDRRDRELLLSVYHPDATDAHGTVFIGDPVTFADWQPGGMARFEVTCHYIMNTDFRIDGDKAEGELYFLAYHRTFPPNPEEMTVGGRYLDRYERRGGVWKIAYRTLVWDHYSSHPVDPACQAALHSLGDVGAGAADVSFTALPMFGAR